MGARQVVHGRTPPRPGGDPVGRVAAEREERPLHAGRADGVAHAPDGQTIYVTEGTGLAQRHGGSSEVIRPGDRVFFAPGEEHWHGAPPPNGD